MSKKPAEARSGQTNNAGGRPLLLYQLPVVLVALLALVGLALVADRLTSERTSEVRDAAMRATVGAFADLAQAQIDGRRQLAELAVTDGVAAAALVADDRDAAAAFERRLQGRVGDLVGARLLQSDVNTPDESGPVALGYAGLDMIRRVASARRTLPGEVHQVRSKTPYFALATPVTRDGVVVGVLFTAWDTGFLAETVDRASDAIGGVRLLQGGADGIVVAGAEDDAGDMSALQRVAVPGSILELAFTRDTGGTRFDPILYAVAAAALLLLLVIAWLQSRLLGRDVKADMATIVTLGESIARHDGATGTPVARVRDSASAIALLGQLARRSAAGTRGGFQSARAATTMPASAIPAGVEVGELDELPGAPPGELSGLAAGPVELSPALFRAYDIRGIAGKELDAGFAERLGQAVGSLVVDDGGRRVAIAHDARASSPELSAALARGLVSTGCDVVDLGMAPTPLLYFGIDAESLDAGIMVTGSHNPPDFNGFKIVVGERVLDGDELQSLRRRMQKGPFATGSGVVESVDLVTDYVEVVGRELQAARTLKVVVDAGNGAAGALAVATLEALGCDVIPLFCEPDGRFPNHHPDPSDPDNLSSLMLEVEAQQADIGLALDGDGDRLGVVDNRGHVIWPDTVLMLLAKDVLERHPGVDIIYDVKSTRHLASFVLGHGGRPIMWKSGHSRMRAKMRETGALLGGEFTGHLFIKDRWFGFDDAVYAAARVIELLALDPRPADEVFADFPHSPSTPEYQLPLAEGQSLELMQALDAHKVFDDARLVELDGLRVEFANGWGLIRPSNTTASLTFRFEADDAAALEQIKKRFRDLLGRVAPDMQAPF